DEFLRTLSQPLTLGDLRIDRSHAAAACAAPSTAATSTAAAQRNDLVQPRAQVVGGELLGVCALRLLILVARRRIVLRVRVGLRARLQTLVVVFALLDLGEQVERRPLAAERLISELQPGLRLAQFVLLQERASLVRQLACVPSHGLVTFCGEAGAVVLG